MEEPRDRNEVTRPRVGRFMTRRESERNPRGTGPIMTTSEETERPEGNGERREPEAEPTVGPR